MSKNIVKIAIDRGVNITNLLDSSLELNIDKDINVKLMFETPLEVIKTRAGQITEAFEDEIENNKKNTKNFLKKYEKFKQIEEALNFTKKLNFRVSEINSEEYSLELLAKESKYKELISKAAKSKEFKDLIHSLDNGNLLILSYREALKEKEEELKALKKEREKKNIKISIAAVSQFFNEPKHKNIFSTDQEEVDSLFRDLGIKKTNKIENSGIILNQSQQRVFEGIIKAFSNTDYQGHYQTLKWESLEVSGANMDTEKATSTIDRIYKGIDKIPVVRLTQAEIIDLAGYDLKKQAQGDKVDVVQALDVLGKHQFWFYWQRAVYDEKGRMQKDKNGKWLKENVSEVGTIFRIKEIRDDKNDRIKYYEIHPSAPLIDQVQNYFLLVPEDWREEVKEIVGKEVKISKYTYEFLFYLRKEFEKIRRHNDKKGSKQKGYILNISWEEIAETIKMPKTIYKANRTRAKKIIEDAYRVAIKLKYLKGIDNNGAVDILYLNEEYYPKPGELR